MPQPKSGSLFLELCLFLSLACVLSPFPVSVEAQSPDDAAVHTTIERFFAAYQQKDLKALIDLWSEKSPFVAAAKVDLGHTFATVGPIELKSLKIDGIELDGDKATVRVAVDLSAEDVQTHTPADGFGVVSRAFYVVKENDRWTVWRYLTAEEFLASRIASAKTDGERKSLLDSNRQMATAPLAKALLVEGDRLVTEGDQSRALNAFEIAQGLSLQVNDKKTLSAVLREITYVYRSYGRPSDALKYAQEALNAAEEAGDNPSVAAALTTLGTLQFDQGNYGAALTYYEKVLKAAQDTGDKINTARAFTFIGIVQFTLGNYQQALDLYQKGLQISQEIGDQKVISTTLYAIGNLNVQRGNYLEALDRYQECLRTQEETGDRDGSTGTLDGIGLVHRHLGNGPLALMYHRKSLAIEEQMGDRLGSSRTLDLMGIVYWDEGNYSEALKFAQKSLSIAQEMGNQEYTAAGLNNVGGIYGAQGNYVQGLSYEQKSLSANEVIGSQDGIAEALTNIAEDDNALGRYSQAVEAAVRSISMAKQLGDRELVVDALTAAGNAYRGLGRINEARQNFGEAIASVEQLRDQASGPEQDQEQFLEKRTAPFYAMTELEVRQGNLPGGLAFAERSRARVLLDVLQSGKVDVTRTMSEHEKQAERELITQLATLNSQLLTERQKNPPDQSRVSDLSSQIENARRDFEGFQTSLYASHPELRVARGQLHPITLSQCAALIPDSNTALLEFAVSKQKTFLFVLTKRYATQLTPELKAYRIDMKEQDLGNLAGRFGEQLSQQGLGFHAFAKRLYDLLLKPAAAELQNKQNLVICPDGPLWGFPFEALERAPNRYLIEDHAVSYAPSLTALLEMSRRSPNYGKAATTLLAMGDPDIGSRTSAKVGEAFMGAQLEPLPQARRQVEMLEDLYGADHSKVYVGSEATEDRLKSEAPSYRVLHLAAHAVVNNASPCIPRSCLGGPRAATTMGCWRPGR
ncbi:MAG TPA: tetratricopeptide repeat protein [Blastocatellia bacterium]|nr:tetratricopeptide repeat protein [Blastocatellia bacterium]